MGCDNIKYRKNLSPFCLSLGLGLMKRLFITLRGYSGLSHNSVGSMLPDRSGHMRWNYYWPESWDWLLEAICCSTLQMRLRILRLTRQPGQNGQFHRGHHSLEYLVTVPSFTDILNILSIAAGVYILQKYDYYSPAIIKGQIILPYIQYFFLRVNFQLSSPFFRVDPPYYCVFVRLGPSPKLKLEPKGLDQSRKLNSHITTTHHHQTFLPV